MSHTADATNCYFNSVWTNILLKLILPDPLSIQAHNIQEKHTAFE